MAKPHRYLSVKSLLLYVVMGICAFALLTMASILLFQNYQQYKENLKHETISITQFVADLSAPIIRQEQQSENQLGQGYEQLRRSLQHLRAFEHVEHVHIYTTDETGQLTIFASYNKPGTGIAPDVISRLNQLMQFQISEAGLEYVKRIADEEGRLGYVYLNASTAPLKAVFQRSFIVTCGVLIVVLVISFMVSLRLQDLITRPISLLVDLVLDITRRRDFSARAVPSHFKELVVLSESFNGLLNRVQDHMARQQEVEEEYQRLNVSLEEKVVNRTRALKAANEELLKTLEQLHQYQRQLVEKEKMASLGDMVAGVAHEVNTPIGLCITASTLLTEQVEGLNNHFNKKSLKTRDMQRFLHEAQENLNIIHRNLKRSSELVSGFKQVAVDNDEENDRVFAVRHVIDEVLITLRPRLKQTKHQVVIHCAEDLLVNSKPGAITQILYNLIANSLEHGFEHMDAGEINIHASIKDSQLHIRYQDNGVGVPTHIAKRIFDPFVTTKRGKGGSGLGMHLVYNLVTQLLGGQITHLAQMDKGAEFLIHFPVKVVTHHNSELA